MGRKGRRNRRRRQPRTSPLTSLTETNGQGVSQHNAFSGATGWTHFQSSYFVGAFPSDVDAAHAFDPVSLPSLTGIAVALPKAEEQAKSLQKSRSEQFWGVLPSLLAFFSSMVIGGVGVWLTHSNNMAQLKNQRFFEGERLSRQKSESESLKTEEDWKRKHTELQTLKELIPIIAGSAKEPDAPDQRSLTLVFARKLMTPEVSSILAEFFPQAGFGRERDAVWFGMFNHSGHALDGGQLDLFSVLGDGQLVPIDHRQTGTVREGQSRWVNHESGAMHFGQHYCIVFRATCLDDPSKRVQFRSKVFRLGADPAASRHLSIMIDPNHVGVRS